MCLLNPSDGRDNTDSISQLDSDDDMEPGEEILSMQVPDGFHLQESGSATLDQTSVKRYALLQRGKGWLTGQISRRAHSSTRDVYDFRVTLAFVQSTPSTALPLDKYSADENAAKGSWVLLEPDEESRRGPHGEGGRAQERKSEKVRTPNVRNVDQPG